LLLILCFILPFFETGCNSTKAAEEVTENAVCDSSEVIDSLPIKSDAEESNSAFKVDTSQKESSNEDIEESISRSLASKSRFLKILLYPEEYTYTGLGAVVETIPHLTYFALTLAFLLFLTSFITKCLSSLVDIQLIFYEGLAFIFLIIAKNWIWFASILIGYKICFFLAIFVFVFDIFQLVNSRKKNFAPN
jgi:hypothetical protein